MVHLMRCGLACFNASVFALISSVLASSTSAPTTLIALQKGVIVQEAFDSCRMSRRLWGG